MPLRNVKGKWYWGSRGPFDTKTKALAVARAAYAHGYTGDKKENDQSISASLEKNNQPQKK